MVAGDRVAAADAGNAVGKLDPGDSTATSEPLEEEDLIGDALGAGFKIVSVVDSTEVGQQWFEAMAERMKQGSAPPLTFRMFLGDDFLEMTRNQVRNLAERRIRTVSYIC